MSNFNKATYASIIFVIVFIGIGRAKLSDSWAGENKLIYFKNYSFIVRVGETKQQQEKGLMFLRSLPSNSGMLFVYKDEAPRSFYMKNTYIPLDIIWMNKEKKVVFIKKNAEPEKLDVYETIYPREEAMYVLELNAGSADKIGLKIGDTWQF
ncbi:MAG: DUF192 domain-containing protein [Candidatus Omnitrophica bacterium]|nr:DUF192 domain-containing protein [Candidatus Omnitrophota bacterium]MBU1923728.1 DUF192 domain-containing protein [Candidatus Omnitrophota bacterium]